MITARQISDVVELLPEREKILIFELAKCLIPDNVAMPEDLSDIKKARNEYERGECVSFTSAGEMAAYFGVQL
jgi:hypothetical protein